MKYELYYKNNKLLELDDYELAEAEARWRYFLMNNKAYENPYILPKNFFILSKNEKNQN